MLIVLVVAVSRAWKERRQISALVPFIGGVVTAFLMNRERMRADDTSGLVAVRLTGWFWLGLATALGIVGVAALRFLKGSERARSQTDQ
jgi:succinate-acetate transporter protein